MKELSLSSNLVITLWGGDTTFLNQNNLREVWLSMKTTIQTIDKSQLINAMYKEFQQELQSEGLAILFPKLAPMQEESTSGIELFDTDDIEIVDNARDGMRVLLRGGEVVISVPKESEKLTKILSTLNTQFVTLKYKNDTNVKFILQEDLSALS